MIVFDTIKYEQEGGIGSSVGTGVSGRGGWAVLGSGGEKAKSQAALSANGNPAHGQAALVVRTDATPRATNFDVLRRLLKERLDGKVRLLHTFYAQGDSGENQLY